MTAVVNRESSPALTEYVEADAPALCGIVFIVRVGLGNIFECGVAHLHKSEEVDIIQQIELSFKHIETEHEESREDDRQRDNAGLAVRLIAVLIDEHTCDGRGRRLMIAISGRVNYPHNRSKFEPLIGLKILNSLRRSAKTYTGSKSPR